ncbi:MAG: ABC transporter ATP-binding protein, partial [Firmicutes bacterium]|nr:ABC transporter ATP-binding protein [Bacillota bacterium]
MNRARSITALKWIYKYTKKQLWWVALLAVFTGGISFGFILLALCSRRILDIVTGDSNGSFTAAVLAIFGVIALQGLFNVLYCNIGVRAYNKIDIRMKQGVFNCLLDKKQPQINTFHSGEILNRFTNDIRVITEAIITIIPSAISMGVRLIAGMIVLISINYKFTFVVCGVGLAVALAARIYSKHFKYLHKLQQTEAGKVRSYIQECVENMVVIKSFSNNKLVCDNLFKRQLEYFKVALKRNTVSNIASTGMYVMFTGGYYAALIWGALQIKGGVLTFGTLTAFLQIIDQIKAPMKDMSGLIPQFYSMTASAERVMELEALEDEQGAELDKTAEELYDEIESLELENVSFGYKDELILKNANMSVKRNSVAAIAGPSGIGKSTMMKLFLALIEQQSGEVYFKTKSGKVYADKNTRRLFAYVPQGNMVLSGTLRENIAFCRPDAADEEIQKAAENALIWDVIQSLPDGLETTVGERGLGLSEGQIQRIAIARA